MPGDPMLHPQARALLDFIEQRGVPPTHTLSPSDARTFYRERRFATQPPAPAVGQVQDQLAMGPNGSIPLRLITAAACGMVKYSINALAASGTGAAVCTPADHTVMCCSCAGSGPT